MMWDSYDCSSRYIKMNMYIRDNKTVFDLILMKESTTKFKYVYKIYITLHQIHRIRLK